MRISPLILNLTGVLTSMLIAAPAPADPAPAHWNVYIGTYTGGGSEGIYHAQLDTATGALTLQGLAAPMENPSFLALHPTLPVLYAVGEMGGNAGIVAAYEMDNATGALKKLDEQQTGGGASCHVAVGPGAHHVAVANYSGGNVALFPIDSAGRLDAASSLVQHEGSSVNPQRQEGPHAHAVNFDPTGAFLMVCDLGLDKVMTYRYDAGKGDIEPGDPAFAPVAPGAGPRHMAFHPNGRFAFVVNEMGSTVTAFGYDGETGAFSALQNISTLPEDFQDSSTTAEIFTHPSGKFLYASNRGHDSIVAYRIDGESGQLSLIGHTPTGGQTPRNFNLDPTGKYLLAANQNSGSIVVFTVNPETGALAANGQSIAVDKPVCIVFANPRE